MPGEKSHFDQQDEKLDEPREMMEGTLQCSFVSSRIAFSSNGQIESGSIVASLTPLIASLFAASVRSGRVVPKTSRIALVI